MNRTLRHTFSILVCVAIVFSSVSAFAATRPTSVMIYSPEGQSALIYDYQIPLFEKFGWSTTPFITIYSLEGESICIPEGELETYKTLGWYTTKVTKLYSPDGEEIVVPTEGVETYLASGWYKVPVVRIYTRSGETAVVYPEQVETYKNLGWYENPEDVLVTLYSSDGRTVSVFENEVDSYLSVGWSFPVTMYRQNGDVLEEKIVLPSEIDSHKAEGWSIYKDAGVGKIVDLFDKYVYQGDYSEAYALVMYYENANTFKGTEYEELFASLKVKANDLCKANNAAPVGFVGSTVTPTAESVNVTISFYNLSEQAVSSFTAQFTAHDKSGAAIGTYTAPVQIPLEANALRGFTWAFPADSTITSVSDARVTDAVLADGTVWTKAE